MARLDVGVRCAATIKADAYGLGAEAIGQALARAGCRDFVVATLDEGLAVRRVLPAATIYVLLGPMPGSEAQFVAAGLTPVLNTIAQVTAWRDRGPAALHVDTGMNRLGMPLRDFDRLAADGTFTRSPPCLVMSHLARADEPGEAMNEAQRRLFAGVRRHLPGVPASFANSAGIFLGAQYHHDLARPGYAIFGGNPLHPRPSPMHHVIELKAKIIQVRSVDRGESVGYGAAHRPSGPALIATLVVGYADGVRRSLGGRGVAYVGDRAVPIVGRVSMDLVTLDVSTLPPMEVSVGTEVELIGAHNTIDRIADAAGTIGFEILTGLGRRVPRSYVGAEP